jgi:integrase
MNLPPLFHHIHYARAMQAAAWIGAHFCPGRNRPVAPDGRRAGIGAHGRGQTARSLRHTGIMSAVRYGAPVEKVQAMARHADIWTTMSYYHETDRVENQAEQFIQCNGSNCRGAPRIVVES